MKILLDENIDIRFKQSFPKQHEVFTIKDMGWTGVKNGTLLKLIAENSLDCWIVVDKNIPYQQNLSNTNFLLIVLDVYRNTLKHLQLLLPKILELLSAEIKNKVIIVKPDE